MLEKECVSEKECPFRGFPGMSQMALRGTVEGQAHIVPDVLCKPLSN